MQKCISHTPHGIKKTHVALKTVKTNHKTKHFDIDFELLIISKIIKPTYTTDL